MRILIVEDDYASRRFLRKFLDKYGECSEAEDGRKALLAYQEALDAKENFELICLDICMPTMDGYETLQKIREVECEYNIQSCRAAKIIMTTSMDSSDDVAKAFELGCVAYIAKPINVVQLDAIMKKLQLI